MRAAGILMLAAAFIGAFVAAQYDPNAALDGVYYVNPIYCSVEGLLNWTCGPMCDFHPGVTNITLVRHDLSESRCYIAYDAPKNRIFVACRGSSNILNWIEDFDFLLVEFPAKCDSCKVHMGFFYSYLTMRDEIMSAVQALVAAYPTADVFVTGHSLGAAQSVFAFYDVIDYVQTSATKMLYNYGQPRVGDPKFARYADTKALPQHVHYRVTHDMDPVPHLPPQFFDYLHFPREVWYKQNITPLGYRVCNDTATHEDPQCSDSVLPLDPSDHTWYLGVHMSCNPEESMMTVKPASSGRSIQAMLTEPQKAPTAARIAALRARFQSWLVTKSVVERMK